MLDGSAGDVSASLVAHLHQCLHGYSLAQISRLPLGLWLCCRDPSPGSLRTVPGQTQGSEPGSEMLPSLREARPSLCVQVGGHHQLPTATPPHRPRSQRACSPQTGHPPQSGDFISRKGDKLSSRVASAHRSRVTAGPTAGQWCPRTEAPSLAPPPRGSTPPSGQRKRGGSRGARPRGLQPLPAHRPPADSREGERGRGEAAGAQLQKPLSMLRVRRVTCSSSPDT